MKRIILTAIAICIAVAAAAQPVQKQPKPGDKKGPMKIEEFISDLSKTQKSKIDIITKRTAKNVDNYRQQLKAVRDSIRSYMDSPDDKSSILFPLYEREGRLQAEISKEYYRSKVEIDNVLTPEQYRTLKEKMSKNRPPRQASDSKHKGDNAAVKKPVKK